LRSEQGSGEVSAQDGAPEGKKVKNKLTWEKVKAHEMNEKELRKLQEANDAVWEKTGMVLPEGTKVVTRDGPKRPYDTYCMVNEVRCQSRQDVIKWGEQHRELLVKVAGKGAQKRQRAAGDRGGGGEQAVDRKRHKGVEEGKAPDGENQGKQQPEQQQESDSESDGAPLVIKRSPQKPKEVPRKGPPGGGAVRVSGGQIQGEGNAAGRDQAESSRGDGKGMGCLKGSGADSAQIKMVKLAEYGVGTSIPRGFKLFAGEKVSLGR
jgi:hypothetical protein